MKSDISQNVILYDWVTLSCKEEDPQFFLDLLGMSSLHWEPMEHGRNGYRQGLYFNSISVLYDGNPGMGICLDMSGQGCRAFEEYGTGDFESLFALVRSDSTYHLSRLDVAFDDHTGILDIQQLYNDTDDGNFVSRFRQAKIEKQLEENKPDGVTIYHGSKKSAILIRIYDKAAERGITDGQHWVRVEMQLRDERASAFIASPEVVGITFRGVLFNYVRYVEASADSHKDRWPTSDYWVELIGEVEKIQLFTKPGIEYNIMQLDNFVFTQAANAIDAALQIHGTMGFIHRIKNRESTGNKKYDRLVDLYGNKESKIHPL
jgi:phage replication initiation protein